MPCCAAQHGMTDADAEIREKTPDFVVTACIVCTMLIHLCIPVYTCLLCYIPVYSYMEYWLAFPPPRVQKGARSLHNREKNRIEV